MIISFHVFQFWILIYLYFIKQKYYNFILSRKILIRNCHINSKIIECEAEENILNKKIVRVKNLLTILSEKQRFVINEFYINSEKGDWKRVSKEYENQFPKYLSIKQLQNIRDVALKDMLEVLNT